MNHQSHTDHVHKKSNVKKTRIDIVNRTEKCIVEIMCKYSLSSVKRCVVIGTTSLCISIIELLLQHQWELLAVISDDPIVSVFCKNRNIKWIKEPSILEESDFVLFSVINYRIISENFLTTHEISTAINYHDSLLPTYAGVNSTTWAILNKETKHGISWHLIVKGLDEGGILKQTAIDISADDTSFSLNLKCFSEAIKSFIALLKEVDDDCVTVIHQDLSKKSYFGKGFLPTNYGLIDFNQTYESISTLQRALYFGEGHSNPVASLKLWDGAHTYLLKGLDFVKKEDAVAGFVYASSGAKIKVGIKDGILSINEALDLAGQSIGDNAAIKAGMSILPYYLCKQEQTILSEVKKAEPKVLTFMQSTSYSNLSFFPKLATEDFEKSYSSLHLNGATLESALCKIALVLLKFLNQGLCIPVIWNNRTAQSGFIQDFIVQTSFLSLDIEQQKLSFSAFKQLIQKQYSTIYSIPKDFAHRYHIKEELHDVVIYLLESDDRPHLVTPHRFSILITKDQVILKEKNRMLFFWTLFTHV